MIQMGREAFERLVRQALEDLPEEFAARLENVAIVVAEEPDPEELEAAEPERGTGGDELFGLYQGVPLSERDSSYADLPDRIVIYMFPILRACASPQEVAREVRLTVIHELGHHFGLSDEEMPY
jgi:predicted Zn-dependent protease with MMP-like domain